MFSDMGSEIKENWQERQEENKSLNHFSSLCADTAKEYKFKANIDKRAGTAMFFGHNLNMVATRKDPEAFTYKLEEWDNDCSQFSPTDPDNYPEMAGRKGPATEPVNDVMLKQAIGDFLEGEFDKRKEYNSQNRKRTIYQLAFLTAIGVGAANIDFDNNGNDKIENNATPTEATLPNDTNIVEEPTLNQ